MRPVLRLRESRPFRLRRPRQFRLPAHRPSRLRIHGSPRFQILRPGSLPDSLSDGPYLTADPMPVFGDGGIEEFRRWVQERLVYPDEALGRGIQGRVVVSFVVERDGTVGGVRTLASPDSLLSEAVIRVVRRSPAWTPGMLEGKPVRVWHSIPVDFTVRADTTGQAAREEVMPEFRGGGLTEFKRWVLRHLELEDDVFFPGDNGWVETEFCINKKGRVRKIDHSAFQRPGFRRPDSPGNRLGSRLDARRKAV